MQAITDHKPASPFCRSGACRDGVGCDWFCLAPAAYDWGLRLQHAGIGKSLAGRGPAAAARATGAAAAQGAGPVFLLAATLRPETMYGQTNAWALPEGAYGAFRAPGGAVYVMTERSARNLSWQDRLPPTGAPERLLALTGQDLIGVPLRVRAAPRGGSAAGPPAPAGAPRDRRGGAARGRRHPGRFGTGVACDPIDRPGAEFGDHQVMRHACSPHQLPCARPQRTAMCASTLTASMIADPRPRRRRRTARTSASTCCRC